MYIKHWHLSQFMESKLFKLNVYSDLYNHSSKFRKYKYLVSVVKSRFVQ